MQKVFTTRLYKLHSFIQFIWLSNVHIYLIFMVILHLFGFIPWIREEVLISLENVIKLPNDYI